MLCSWLRKSGQGRELTLRFRMSWTSRLACFYREGARTTQRCSLHLRWRCPKHVVPTGHTLKGNCPLTYSSQKVNRLHHGAALGLGSNL